MARVVPSPPADNTLPNAWAAPLNAAINYLRDKSLTVVNVTDYPNVVDSAVISSQAGIEAAVTDALALGAVLHFPAGQYLSGATIPNLHAIPKSGPGRIVTGSSTYWMEPTTAQMNTLYVRTTGSNTNDGLTTGRPLLTIARACTILNERGTLAGTWRVDIGAGSFASAGTLDVATENPVEFVGVPTAGHPAVPTTIIGTALGASSVGLTVLNGTRVKVTDIKFFGYNGSTSSCGINAAYDTVVHLVNCHFDRCFFGASSTQGNLDVKGGVFDNCGRIDVTLTGNGAAIRSLQLNRHAIGLQSAGILTQGPILKNNRVGVLAQESSTGHIDWCTFEDNEDGVLLQVNSRANLDGSSFVRNVRGLRLQGNSHGFLTSATSFGTGADVNSVPVVRSSGSELATDRIVDGVEMSYGNAPSAVDTSFPAVTITSTSATLVTVKSWTLKAPFWRVDTTTIAAPRRVMIRVFGVITGATDVKTVRLQLGAAVFGGVTFAAAEQSSFLVEGTLYLSDLDVQRFVGFGSAGVTGVSRVFNVAATEAFTADTTLLVSARVGNAADSIRFDVVELSVAG